jgi:PAS domain S-box-containing protein
MNNFHRLLQRQIAKHGLNEHKLSEIEDFLRAVDEAYISSDKDLRHLENILERSSQELYRANQRLKLDVESKATEILKTKQQLERVVNNVRNVIFQTNLKGEWIFLNFAWEKLSGYTIAESINKPFSHFLDCVEPDNCLDASDLFKNEVEQYQKVIQIKTKDGVKKWIDLSLRLTRDANGNPDGTIGNIVDVTEIKESEIKLIQAQEKLKQAHEAKESFLSTMSHEIRTPLNGVIGLANILMMEDHLPNQLENLNTLLFSAEHLLGLINDLMDLNKIQAGKIEFESIEFSFDTMLQGINRTFTYQAEEKGIRFMIKRDDSVPSVLIGDSVRLLQVLTNLIGNAMKFTKEGKVTLDIENVSETKDEINLHFQVIDSGIGIKSENIQKIFERFVQAESTITRKYGGTGLGLTISKSLLVQMGGELHVDSTFGKGSNFHFTLTFKKSDRFKLEAPSFIDLQPSYAGMDGFRILVAEDNLINIQVIERLFKKWKIDYVIAKNGKECVEKLEEDDYDLILMDIQMPVMDGYSATKCIRSRDIPKFQKIPIVALTASAEMTIQKAAKECGMNDFMCKPFNPVKLYNKIKEYYKQPASVSL